MDDTIAARIRRAIARSELTGGEIAERCGFRTPTQLYNTLARLDKDPDAVELRTLRKIATGLSVSFEWLVTGRDELVDAALRSPRFRDRADWSALLTSAKSLSPAVPDWVWQFVGECRPVDDAITAGSVADFALYVLRHRRQTS